MASILFFSGKPNNTTREAFPGTIMTANFKAVPAEDSSVLNAV